MDWVDIAKEQGGWAVVGLMVAAFLRALDTGRLVLGREYQRVLREMAAIAERAEAMAQEQREAAERERADYRARLDRKQSELDQLRGGSP